MHRIPSEAPSRLRQNRERYDQALRVVRHRAATGDVEGVLRSATVAANLAWRAPIGLLGDPELERLVVRAVRGNDEPARVDGDRTGGRVLHVLSEAYDLGGHTRLVWRWIARDPRHSDVALTNQDHPLPARLADAVTASGGRIHDLRSGGSALAARAAELRRLMDAADLVVCHLHPYDAVLLAAASLPGSRPPIVYENHSDFSFWLGLGATDVVSDFLHRGRQLSSELRGIRAERLGLLPLPVDEVDPATPRADVRRALRLGADDVVALSVSAAFKMEPVWGQGFDGLVARALEALPRLKLVLAGVSPEGRWRPLAQRFAGRLLLPGPVEDPYSLYAAADIYLESYPIPAGTSVLEAALAGLPVLSMHDLTERHGRGRLLQGHFPGLAGVRHSVSTDDDYVSRLRKLVRDPRLRAEQGAAARDGVLAAHAGAGWSAALEDLYTQARTAPAADLDEYPKAIEDADYGAMLVPMVSSLQATPSLTDMAAPLREQRDERLVCDLFVALNRHEGGSLSVRVAPGWEHQPEWTRRLLALAAHYATLAVSLPFAAGDDGEGSLSVAHLTRLLALDGRTTSDCGEISLDARTPTFSGPSVSGELPPTSESLDKVETLVSSPLWEPAPV